MSTSQRVSRGFNRLALFLAAVPLLIGIVWIAFMSNDAIRRNQKIQCAHDYLTRKIVIMPDKAAVRFPDDMPDDQIRTLILQKFPDITKTPEIARQPSASQPFAALSDKDLLALRDDIREAAQARKAGGAVASPMVPAHTLFAPDTTVLSLKDTGCSTSDYETVTYGEARNVYRSLFSGLVQIVGVGLAITLALTLTVYGVVRAIGWVIGGFAAS